MRPLLEVCIDSIESAKAAFEGKADRLEVCSSLALGGLTPTCGLLTAIKQICPGLSMYAMIRPRSGDFVYSAIEIEQMKFEIDAIKKLEIVDGFVLGVLKPDGSIDKENCNILLSSCLPLPVTFHRAFDSSLNPLETIEELIELGFARLLTSGQQSTAEKGIKLIKELIDKADGKLIIMPGCGVNELNLEAILRETGAKEFHSSASLPTKSKMTTTNDGVSMGKGEQSTESEWSVCDSNKVVALIKIAQMFNN